MQASLRKTKKKKKKKTESYVKVSWKTRPMWYKELNKGLEYQAIYESEIQVLKGMLK